MSYKLGSLFDGSGGFPLAGSLCGIEPVWASEVEPYPIAVTRSRFPSMKHLGDISKINGAEVEPVHIVTFGSPCQDLSVAGLRKGLRHEANGDEETTRSGLFIEAIRIIKEMLEATNGVYPNVVLWENVPGAFSSNGGNDFRVVLEELIKIVEPDAVMPPVPKAGWAYADSYCGDGWSLAYRVFDAQYWGVPQRRRRIHLVLHLRGQCAQKILFERKGVRGYFAEGSKQGERVETDSQNGAGAAEREGAVCRAYSLDSLASNSMKSKNPHSGFREVKVAKTLDTSDQNPSKNQGGIAIVQPVYCLQGNGIDRADTAGCNGKGVKEDVCYTLNTIDRHAVCYMTTYQKVTGPLMANSHPGSYTGQDAFSDMLVAGNEWQSLNFSGVGRVRNIVRRLTPTECARLQGFADRWGDIDQKDSFTPEELAFWQEVRNTHAAINGKAVKDYTEAQMLTWYNKLQTDSSEYKMWGNGIALPPALYCMQGIVDALEGAKS